MTLQEFFSQHQRLALGLSGGVDSAYLLMEAVRCGCKVQPYFVNSIFQPRFELKDAQSVCEKAGVVLKVLEIDPLRYSHVRRNDSLRCYYCKQQVFGMILQAAKEDGFLEIIDGTNASDCERDRPGMKALKEMQVYSPLRLCGVTKEQVRENARQMELFLWNKPAYACLATRIPTGTEITKKALQQVEQAEEAVFKLGFSDFRVRINGTAAKLQLPFDQMEQAVRCCAQITRELKPMFESVVLDLEPRGEN